LYISPCPGEHVTLLATTSVRTSVKVRRIRKEEAKKGKTRHIGEGSGSISKSRKVTEG
jgi:hypothetical protein